MINLKADYYREQADYDGVVATARLEIEGLTVDNYLGWYFRRWKLHYQSNTVPRRGSFYDIFPMGRSWPRVGRWSMLVQRKQSRLYVLRKMRPLKNTTTHFANANSVVHRFDNHNQVADELLIIAQLLKRRATELVRDAAALREARTGSWGMLNSMADFYKKEVNAPHTTGRRIWTIQAFQWLLTRFDEMLAGQVDSAEVDRWAGLLTNYTLVELDALLVFGGLLDTSSPLKVANGTKPAQWVAIAAALYERKKTRADRAALHRAFFDTYGPAVGSLRSFQSDYNEGNEAAKLCYDRAISRLG